MKKGFTLIELMVVIAILIIILSLAVSMYNSSKEKGFVEGDGGSIEYVVGSGC